MAYDVNYDEFEPHHEPVKKGVLGGPSNMLQDFLALFRAEKIPNPDP